MPGIGVRLWNPPYRSGLAEVTMTVINAIIEDSVALGGTTIPYKSLTGNMLVRLIGRANTASRPLTVTVKWNNISMVEKALFAESGAGGTFVGIWTLAGQTPADASIVFTSSNTGCAAVRIGEIGGAPIQVYAGANAGYGFTRTMAAGNVILSVGGTADLATDPFTSSDLEVQWLATVPAKTSLPNRNNGLAAHFGISYAVPPDGKYDIVPATAIAGVIGAIELKLGGGSAT